MENIELRYGDLINIRNFDKEYLMSYGFTDYKVYNQQRDDTIPCTNTNNTIFKIIPKLNQEVRKEQEKKKKYHNKMLTEQRSLSSKTVNIQNILKKYHVANPKMILDLLEELHSEIELQEKRTKVEEKLNQTLYEHKYKSPVKQGELVQLIHYESTYFLASKKSMGADQDKSCLMVCLMESGSFQSIWKILPSVNHKKQGDNVRYKESILLMNNHNGYYLNCSGDLIPRKRYNAEIMELTRINDKPPDRRPYQQTQLNLKEVNASTSSLEWTIILQRTCQEDEDQSWLHCGDMIMVKHTAHKGQLTADIYSSDLKELNEGNKACYLRIYRGPEHYECYDSGMFFVLEKGNSIAEQPLAFASGEVAKQTTGKDDSHKFRLKHLNSGRQVRMAEIDIIFKNKKKADKQERILGLSKLFESAEDKDKAQGDQKEWDEHTVFQMYSTSREVLTHVQVDSYVKFKFFKVRSAGAVGSKMWMGVGGREIMKSKDQFELPHSKKEKENFQNKIEDDTQFLEKRTILLTDSDKDDNSFLLEKVEPLQAHAVKCLQSSLSIVGYYVNRLKSGQPDMTAKYGDSLFIFMTHMNQLLQWSEGQFDKMHPSLADTRYPPRQKLARDVRLIDMMIDIVYYPFEVYKNEVQYKNIGDMGQLLEIQRAAYMIIKNSFLSQRRNEFYTAQWIRLFIHQTLQCDERNSILAEKTLASLIQFNKRLLDKQINEELINNLINTKDKIKNINLLSSLCVCKGEAVKSKQNKIIELFATKHEVFQQFFPRSDEIQVHGKGKIIVDQRGKIMKTQDFEWMKAAVSLVSNLCFDRNQKAIEMFQDVYKFYVVHNNFIDRAEITYDIKAVYVTLVQHLILDREPYKHTSQPIQTLEQPPVRETDLESENSSIENLKLMKKFVNNFLHNSEAEGEYDIIMNSVLNLIYFMVSHKIYGKTEITIIIKTINERMQEQMAACLGQKITNVEITENVDNEEEDTEVIKSSLTYMLQVINLFLDSSQDLNLFATTDTELTAGSALQASTLKIVNYIDNNAMSLNKSLSIINQVSQSRIHQSVIKFLTNMQQDFKEMSEGQQDFQTQILLQMGVMPRSYYQKIMRNYTVMSQEHCFLFDVNIHQAINRDSNLSRVNDLDQYMEFSPDNPLANFNLNIDHFMSWYEDQVSNLLNEKDASYQLKIFNPLKWVKELVMENKVFDDDEDSFKVKTRFYELTLSYMCSSNNELSFGAYKTLMDDLFTVESFVNQLENLQLVDNDRLKDQQKKVDIIQRSLLNKLNQLNDLSNDSKKSTESVEDTYLLVVQVSKLIFWLIGMCITDETQHHPQDYKSNQKTIDNTGFKNVEFMFEDLFQQQKNIDVERDFNQLEEEMNTILKKMQCQADVDELLDLNKWKYFVQPRDYTMQEDIQTLQLNMKIQDVMFEYINYDTNDIEDKTKKSLITALKCIAQRFLLLNCHKNVKILTDFQQFLPTIVLDLKQFLIAGQLQVEIISNDKSLLKRLNTGDLYKICILIQSQDEQDNCEKAVGIKIFKKCLQFKQEVFKNNQNEVFQILNEKGLNLLPKIFKRSNEIQIAQRNEKEFMAAVNFVKDQISSTSDNSENMWIEIPPLIYQNIEQLALYCALTEKSNQFTESNIKRLISFEKLLKIMANSSQIIIFQRKLTQLMIDAFVDLEEIEDQECESITNINKIIHILIDEIGYVKRVIEDDNFERYQTIELIPNGPLSIYNIKTEAQKFIYNEIIQLSVLIYNSIKHQVYEHDILIDFYEKIMEFDPPDKIYKPQNLHYMIFLDTCDKLEIQYSDKAKKYQEENLKGLLSIENQLKQQDPVTLKPVDSYDFMRENYLIFKQKEMYPKIQEGKINEFLSVMIALIKSNQLFNLMCAESIRNFNLQVQTATFFVSKPTINRSLINILILKHHQLETNQILHGLRYLRLSIESFNQSRFVESLYWQTKDQATVEVEISDSQNAMIELGAVEVVIKMISIQNDPEILGESILLGCALLLGGNAKAQQAQISLYAMHDYDNQMQKLQDTIENNFNQIYNEQVAEQNSNRNLTKKTLELMSHVWCVDREMFADEKDNSQEHYLQTHFDYTQLSFTTNKLHEIDNTRSNLNDFKNNYKRQHQIPKEEIMFRIMKWLQNLCENHNNATQDFVREQLKGEEVSTKSRNFVNLLCFVQRQFFHILSKSNIWLGIQVVDTLIEFVQGPCRLNQIQIVKEKGLDTARDVLQNLSRKSEMQRMGFHSEEDQQLISIFKYKTVVLINSLQEGNKNDPDFKIFEEIPKSIEYNILAGRLVESYCNQAWKQIIPEERKTEFKMANLNFETEQRNEWIFKEAEAQPDQYITTGTLSDQYLQEGFNVCILMLNIADHNKMFKTQIQEEMTDDHTKQAQNFLKVKICNIDVCINDKIWRVYFPFHPYTQQLSDVSKKNFVENVDRETPVSKLAGLLSESKYLQQEMKQQYHQNQLPVYPTPSFLQMLLDLLFFIAQVQNLMFLSFPMQLRCDKVEDCQPVLHEQFFQDMDELQCKNNFCHQDGNPFNWFIGVQKKQLLIQKTASKFLGIFQITFGIIIFFVWQLTNQDLLKQRYWQVLIEGHKQECDKILKTENIDEERINDFYDKKTEGANTDIQKLRTILYLKGPDAVEFVSGENKEERNQQSWAISTMKWMHDVMALISNSNFIQRLLHIVMSVLGTFLSEICFIFHIQDIVQRHKDLQNIIQSITKNGEMLLLTLIFTVIIVQVFSLVSFFALAESWQFDDTLDENGRPHNHCNSIPNCLLFNINVGVRAGGNHLKPRSIFAPDQQSRFILDILQIVIVVIVMMNIVFGIVIDTFGELQEINKSLNDDIENKCFICGLSRDTLEKQGISFDQHVSQDHNQENQLQQIVHLKEMDKAQQNGIELEINGLIERGETGFFPRKKLFGIQIEDDEDEGNDETTAIVQDMLQSTRNIKSDIHKINSLLDNKINNM